MIDFIQATTTFNGKVTTILPHLGKPDAVFSSGWTKYYLNGCERLALWIHPEHQMVKLEGSVPYYWQGNNFSFNQDLLREAINHLSSFLKVDWWKAELNAFEYGVIMEVKMKPKEYILHHSAKPSEHLLLTEKEKDNGSYRNWNDRNVKLKMYDAGRNIIVKQGEDRKTIIREAGWQDAGQFLKWEAHYLKPECLNRGVALHLYDLMNKDWNNTFKEDLYLQYQRLLPMKSIILPDNKKDLSTADILAITFAEQSLNEGQPLEALKKILYGRINSIPDEVLSRPDKDARKRQVKALLDKIKESPQSKWDLSEQIQKTLENE